MTDAREVIAEAIRTAPTDSGGFDEWDARTVRAVQADSILQALEQAGFVVVRNGGPDNNQLTTSEMETRLVLKELTRS